MRRTTNNYYWKCPRCGKINSEEEVWWEQSSSEYETKCEKCGFKVNVLVEMEPLFSFSSVEDGTDIEGMEKWALPSLKEAEE